jgi:hypothetical protein
MKSVDEQLAIREERVEKCYEADAPDGRFTNAP